MTTKKQLVGGQRRSLKAMAEKLRNMAAEWGDVDNYNENQLREAAAEEIEPIQHGMTPTMRPKQQKAA